MQGAIGQMESDDGQIIIIIGILGRVNLSRQFTPICFVYFPFVIPYGAFQDRSTSASHPHVSEIDKVWSMGLSGALKPAVRIFLSSD